MINETFKKYEESILQKLKISYSGLDLCELGNQSYAGKMAKQMYTAKGVKHTSIDINGLGGSLKLNLDSPLPKNLENKFSVVTNYGTSEHVNNQYSTFKNIHVVGKVGCIMIHGVPLIGHWLKHSRYYYSTQFFIELSIACNYRLVDFQILNTAHYSSPKNLVACVLRKDKNTPFISLKKFSSLSGLQDSCNLAKTGNYSVKQKRK